MSWVLFMVKKLNIYVMLIRMRILNVFLILSSFLELCFGLVVFGGCVVSLYIIKENVIVLMRIISKIGVMNVVKNVMFLRW